MSKQTKYLNIIIIAVFSLLVNSSLLFASVEVTAEAAILMEVETGKVLYRKNIHQQRPPASTTKIMTGILAIEEGNLDQRVTVSKHAAAEGGSSIYLSPNETLKLRELIYGLLIKSGNDAAVAIAEHIAGSVSKFAQMMNQKAREIGAVNTAFKNPNGLPENGHLTTAYDLAKITRYALQNNFFSKVVATSKKRISWPGHSWDRILENTNKLLGRSEMVDGVKTGYTRAAGRCLVASATKEGQQLISVVLKSRDLWQDSLKLLNHGFNNYRKVEVIKKGEVLKKINLKKDEELKAQAAKEFSLVVPKNKEKEIKKVIRINEELNLPIRKGEKIGSVAVCNQDNLLLGRVELIADKNVELSPLNSFFNQLSGRIQTYF